MTAQFQPQFARELIEGLATAPVEAYRRSVRLQLALQCLAEPARPHPLRKRPGHAPRRAQDTNQALPRCARDAKWPRLSMRWSPSRNSRIRLLRPGEGTSPMTRLGKRYSATFRQFGSVTPCAECLVDKQLLAPGFAKRAFLKLRAVIAHQSSVVIDTLDDIVLPRPQPILEFHQLVYLNKGYDTLWLLWEMPRRHYDFHNRTCGEGTGDLRTNSKKKVRRWPVERIHSWTDCFQHSLIHWETPNPIISRNKHRNSHRGQRRCLRRREVNARSVRLYFSLARAVESDSAKFSGRRLEETLASLPRQ